MKGPGMPIPLPPGLGAIDGLVRSCYTRTDRKQDRPLPIVVLLGTPGSGKSHALAHFARVTRTAPSAQLDFADSGPRRPYEIAVQIVFHLSRRYRDLPRLRFPRLLLGLIAIGPSLSGTNPDLAQAQLRQALRDARQRHIDPAQLAAWVDAGAATLGLPVPATEQVITLLVRAFEYTPVNSILNRNLSWYAQRNALSAHGAVDELLDLNRRSHSDARADVESVDERLCEAFLADLRAAYARHPSDQNCLVLLDNIDYPESGANDFLRLIARLRAEHAVSQQTSYDPLLIVATSATTQAVPGPSDGRPHDPYIQQADSASYQDWLARPDAPPANWWYPVRLRDFSEIEVVRVSAHHEEEVAARAQRPVQRNLRGTAPLVHRLTYGHPWSVRQLHFAIGELLAAGASDHDLHGLLEVRVPNDAHADHPEDRSALGELVRKRLLGGLTEDQRTAAVKLSAARTPSAAVNAGLLADLSAMARDTVMAELQHRLWLFAPIPEDANTRGGVAPSGYLRPAADETRPVLHPWLRLLLLEELAGVTGDGGVGWQRAHRDLHAWHERHGRRLDALYHLLALDRLDAVVSEFAQSFTRTETAADAVNWLGDLYHVTAAPMRRAQLPDGRASRNAGALARRHAPLAYTDYELGRPLAELTAALWLAGDPRNRLPLDRPELNYPIGAWFRQLAMSPNADTYTLLNEAARYST
jgi:hypothetical protein